ncbi:hypothetical protein BEP19_06890 [Ammoniphilus oxalaticus]|uniref:SGNH hydrolase-type esterase domain-containing protein n=2 Tax=Ammoniphilus oxalaticus TaxID=66863 RepID=A0A419SL49_9BACL|nr:hypothetical protein BEP19_06890 [Ammoniphilus oxalaticus]
MALLFTCLLGWGFVVVVQEQFFPAQASEAGLPKRESVEQMDTPKSLLALGDSLTRGTGDPQGKGYVGLVVEALEEQELSGEKISLFNWSIRGQTSGQLIAQLKETEMQRQLKTADLILLTIGGNDLFQGGQSLVELDPRRIGEIQKVYLKNLEEIFALLREFNQTATVYHIGLYDPFFELESGPITSKFVRDWNYQSAEIAAKFPKIVAVPTYDLFELGVTDYLYSDQFHPNDLGYQLIAERLVSLIQRDGGGGERDE